MTAFSFSISETISTATDGITTQKLCVASEQDYCATETTIRSKRCTWFEVYEVPINISCGRLCLGKCKHLTIRNYI